MYNCDLVELYSIKPVAGSAGSVQVCPGAMAQQAVITGEVFFEDWLVPHSTKNFNVGIFPDAV